MNWGENYVKFFGKTWASTSLKTNESWNLQKKSHLKTWVPWPQEAKTLSFLGFHVNSLGVSAGNQRPWSNSHCLEKAFMWVCLRWQNRAWDVWHDVSRWSSVMSFDWTDWGSSRICMIIFTVYTMFHCVSTCFNEYTHVHIVMSCFSRYPWQYYVILNGHACVDWTYECIQLYTYMMYVCITIEKSNLQ